MLSKRNTRLVAITFAAAFLLMVASPAYVQAVDPTTESLKIGPYIDKIVYQVITTQDARVLAMQAGTIDMDNSYFDPSYYTTLAGSPNIDIYSARRLGYGHITINCRDAPLNESVLRRAFAFAFDKTRVTDEVMNGWNQEHDSLVPFDNPYCIEDQLLPHYYTAMVTEGNALLNASGKFPYLDPAASSSVRTYKGQPIDPIKIEYSSVDAIPRGTAQIGVDALLALGIPAIPGPASFNEYISRLDQHGDYDMVFYALNYLSDSVDWLARTYRSDWADVNYQNPCNFRNATFDSMIPQLLYSTTTDAIANASAWMQKILHEQVPRLVCYVNTYNMAYRTDKFTGFVADAARYIVGPWTMRKIHNIGGTFGGTLTVALSQEPDSFNIFVTNSAYAAAVLENQWPQLYMRGPDLKPFGDLAESCITETHADNPDVPSGHTRFTIDIVQNATWSDGVKLTADDVAFTNTYYFESYLYGNPAGATMGDLVAAYAPTPYRVIVEFSTVSYWHFQNFAYNSIIPKHIFKEGAGIGYAGWNIWNPGFDPAQPNVNCGPFHLTSMEAGEFYEVSYNPTFYYAPSRPTTTTTLPTTTPGPDWTLALVAGAVGAAVVILVGGFVLFRQK